MHPKIQEALNQDLKVIHEAVQRQTGSDNKYKEVVLCLAQTFPFQQDPSNFKNYEKVYNMIQQMVKHIEVDLCDAMSDINTWLVGNNFGYDEISLDLMGSDPRGEVYDYLIESVSKS